MKTSWEILFKVSQDASWGHLEHSLFFLSINLLNFFFFFIDYRGWQAWRQCLDDKGDASLQSYNMYRIVKMYVQQNIVGKIAILLYYYN